MTAVPFRKRKYNAYRFNTQLGNVSADTFTATVRERPDENATVIFNFSVDMTDAATGYVELVFDATLVAITQSIGYCDIKRVTGGSAVELHDDWLVFDLQGTTTP